MVRTTEASGALMDDDKLVKECLAGNPRAQKLLYDKYARKMYGVCLRYAPDHSMADDFLQEGFIRVFMKLSGFKAMGSLEGWMRRIMVNTALEKLRKKDILRNSMELPFTGMDESDVNDIMDEHDDDSMIERVPSEIIYQALHQMPMGFRTVFNLFAVENCSHKEISHMLGISEGTSKSQYARARAWLQKKLNEREQNKNARS